MRGLETEIPPGVELTARVISLLYQLEKRPVVRFDIDDGEIEDLQILLAVCKHVGYRLLHVQKRVEEATTEKGLGTGTWILMDDRRIPKI